MSKLERNPWFAGLTAFFSVMTSFFVMRMAGLEQPFNAAQWVLYILCVVGFQRCYGLLAWLGVLLVAPKSRLLDRGA